MHDASHELAFRHTPAAVSSAAPPCDGGGLHRCTRNPKRTRVRDVVQNVERPGQAHRLWRYNLPQISGPRGHGCCRAHDAWGTSQPAQESHSTAATGYDPLRADEPDLARTMAASVTQRIAFGERVGQ